MILTICSIISLIWFIGSAGLNGKFGNNFRRRLEFLKFDDNESQRLLRIIDRYNSGEMTVQFSRYGDNLLFTKMVSSNLPEVLFAESRIYVSIQDPECYVYGWTSDEPKGKHLLMSSSTGCRGVINNEAFNALQTLVNVLREEPISKKRPSRLHKRKNEEVHLS